MSNLGKKQKTLPPDCGAEPSAMWKQEKQNMKDLLSALVGQGHIAVTGLLGIPLEAQQKAVRLAKQLSASVSVGTLEDEANHCLTGNAAQQAV